MKVEAGTRPQFAEFCVTLGQFYHKINSRINVIASGYKFIGVKPLPTEQALNDGIGYISEMMVISFSATVIVIEYNRSENKNAEKAKKTAEKEALDKKTLEDRCG